MKILLLGERGYLGSFLRQHLDVDILDKREVYDNCNEYEYVINCIGKPNLEYCETHKEETDYSNRDVILDIQLFYPTSKIINFSSYYVYDSTELCDENSNTTRKFNYTRQKLESEELVKNGVSFRIGKLFGHLDVNAQSKLTEHVIKNDNLSLDTVTFNPTSLEQVLKVVKHELSTNSLNGVYNLSNLSTTTHYEYGVFIDTYLNTHKQITKVDKIDRSFSSYGRFTMNCEKLNSCIQLTHWKIDMIKYLDKFLNNENV